MSDVSPTDPEESRTLIFAIIKNDNKKKLQPSPLPLSARKKVG